jgi:DNA/RNA-binding domain of Phe-tRNA-synthetase-like protein
MSTSPTPAADEVLASARIDPHVVALFPTYAALLVVARGLTGGPTDESSELALASAEQSGIQRLAATGIEDLPELMAWREAYRSFGVKPRQARSSVESLLRRAESGLPRVDRLTDLYNAVSVLHLLPVGGEDLDQYVGAPRVVLARGDELFDTVADGEPVHESPAPGEVVWRDDVGVTCRRWNWRQGRRTRLTPSTTNALFILDGLGPVGPDALRAAGADLEARLLAANPSATFATRLLTG